MNRQVLKNGPLMLSCLAGLSAGVLLSPHRATAAPLGSSFTYQGSLKSAGVPVSSSADFRFTLFDAATGGTAIAGPVARNNVAVADGLFQVTIDFGVAPFDGDARWLEIEVRSPAGSGAFTKLATRQSITPTPYALQVRGLFVNDAGNIGIGTTNPARRLHLNAAQAIMRLSSTGSSNGSVIELRNDTASPNFDGAINFMNDAGAVRGQIAYRGADNAMTLRTNNVERMRINSSGNVGIGTSSPDARLHVSGPGPVLQLTNSSLGSVLQLTNSGLLGSTTVFTSRSINSQGGQFPLRLNDTSDGNVTLAEGGGNVGIGTDATANKLEVAGGISATNISAAINIVGGLLIHSQGNISALGNITATGTCCASDKRFKTNVKPLDAALDRIEKLRPVWYDWNRDEFPERKFSEQRQLGLIAQELREILPELVHEGDDGYLAVDYSRLTPVLITAIRELRTEKDRQLSEKSAELDALKVRLDRLEAAMNAKK